MSKDALIRSIGSTGDSIEQVGGKALSLLNLYAAGFSVPEGFIITTAMYNQYLTSTGIRDQILQYISPSVTDNPGEREAAARKIGMLFDVHPIPGDLAELLTEAYRPFKANNKPVVVRSSATAEDLPEISFAGQMDTILNITNPESLIAAVRQCWASLWTGRVMAYREKMKIPHARVSMAVVVQELVIPGTAGILFTANPLTGNREEMLISAGYGMGDAVVSGIITPDTFRVSRYSLSVVEETTGSQEKMTVPAAGGGIAVKAVPGILRSRPALNTARIQELIRTGREVEMLFDGTPQDIEWCYANNRLFLLQARPATGLPSLPAVPSTWEPPVKDSRWIRRQAAENLPDPLSPLFDEIYLREGLDYSLDIMQRFMGVPRAMDKLYNKPMFGTINGYAYMRADMNLTPFLFPLIIGAMIGGVAYILRGGGIRYWQDYGLKEYCAKVDAWRKLDIKALTGEQLIEQIRTMARADAVYWYAASLAFGTAKSTEGLLNWFLKKMAKGKNLTTGMFLRGFPSRTLDAQILLERIAGKIKTDQELCSRVINAAPGQVQSLLAAQPGGKFILEEIRKYFELYGHQTYTIDFAEPVLSDTPESVMRALQVLVQPSGNKRITTQQNLAAERDALVSETCRAFGFLRRMIFKKLLKMALRYGPYREESLFYVGYAWPLLRRCAHELGTRLVKAKLLSAPDDVYYLYTDELSAAVKAAAAGERLAYPAKLAQYRRALREARKQLHPPGAVPENYLFKLGKIDLANRESQVRDKGTEFVMRGFAISPGQVTAPACVILSQADFNTMQPGAILVCAATTPAWTPLFTQAAGLVTDIGGVLAHGSIVAREFGLPAVMGTGNATQRIKQGQRITVDGTKGIVILNA